MAFYSGLTSDYGVSGDLNPRVYSCALHGSNFFSSVFSTQPFYGARGRKNETLFWFKYGISIKVDGQVTKEATTALQVRPVGMRQVPGHTQRAMNTAEGIRRVCIET